jgi:hypothetical protein
MFDLTFQLKTRPDGTVILAFGPFFRVVFALLTGVFGWGLVDRVLQGETVPVVSVLLFLLVLLGFLYEERWKIDPAKRVISNRRGLLVLAGTRRWDFQEIAAVEYTTYQAGSTPYGKNTPPDSTDRESDIGAISRFGHMDARKKSRFLRYSLILRDGSRVRMELRRVRDWNTDRKIPEGVAATIGVDLEFSDL